MRRLYGVEGNFAVHHAKVGPETASQAIVPVLEVSVGPSRSHIARASIRFVHSVVEAIFGAESSIELRLEVAHEGPISHRLGLVVPHATITNDSRLSVMEATTASTTIAIRQISFVTSTIEIHLCTLLCLCFK
jgi:hypothetical protein